MEKGIYVKHKELFFRVTSFSKSVKYYSEEIAGGYMTFGIDSSFKKRVLTYTLRKTNYEFDESSKIIIVFNEEVYELVRWILQEYFPNERHTVKDNGFKLFKEIR